jgi:hypothetical protein
MGDDKRYCRKGPCNECPFGRATKPGTVGGSDPRVFVGQAIGPFLLNCHTAPGYWDNPASTDLIQCGGAAIYRANVRVSDQLPSCLHRLPPGDLAFATPAELVAHHLQVPLTVAEAMLEATPPERLLAIEIGKIRLRHLGVMPKRDIEQA